MITSGFTRRRGELWQLSFNTVDFEERPDGIRNCRTAGNQPVVLPN